MTRPLLILAVLLALIGSWLWWRQAPQRVAPVDLAKSRNVTFPKPKPRTVGDLAIGETGTTWVRFDEDTGQPFVIGTTPINESWQRDVITRHGVGTYSVRLGDSDHMRYTKRISPSTNVLVEQEPKR